MSTINFENGETIDFGNPEEVDKYEKSLTENTHSNYEICKNCGGGCCKNLPCGLSPSQIVSLGYELTEESLTKCLESGDYALDYWFNNFSKDDYYWYYIRYRAKGGLIADTHYIGTECVMLTDSGCKLPFDKRGIQGKSLKPVAGKHGCAGPIGKKEMGIIWKTYRSILGKLWDKYESESR